VKVRACARRKQSLRASVSSVLRTTEKPDAFGFGRNTSDIFKGCTAKSVGPMITLGESSSSGKGSSKSSSVSSSASFGTAKLMTLRLRFELLPGVFSFLAVFSTAAVATKENLSGAQSSLRERCLWLELLLFVMSGAPDQASV